MPRASRLCGSLLGGVLGVLVSVSLAWAQTGNAPPATESPSAAQPDAAPAPDAAPDPSDSTPPAQPAPPATPAAPPAQTQPVNGRAVLVLSVAKPLRQVAVIDAGTADGLKVGDRLQVQRDGGYVGLLEVFDPRDTESFARILHERLPIVRGDTAYRLILPGPGPNPGPDGRPKTGTYAMLSRAELEEALERAQQALRAAEQKRRDAERRAAELALDQNALESGQTGADRASASLRQQLDTARQAHRTRTRMGHGAAVATFRSGFGQAIFRDFTLADQTPTLGWTFHLEQHFERWLGVWLGYGFTEQPGLDGQETIHEQFRAAFFTHEGLRLPLPIGFRFEYRHQSFPRGFAGVRDSDEFEFALGFNMPMQPADSAWPGRGVNPPRLGAAIELVRDFQSARGLDLRLIAGFGPWATVSLDYNFKYYTTSARWGAFGAHLRLPVLQGVGTSSANGPRVLPFWDSDPDEDWLTPFVVLEADWIVALGPGDARNALRIGLALRLSF